MRSNYLMRCALTLLVTASLCCNASDMPRPVLVEPEPHAVMGGTMKLLISEKYNMMYCYIQKNGCTQGVQLFLEASNQRVSGDVWSTWYNAPKHGAKHPGKHEPWSVTFPEQEVSAAWRNDSFARIVYVRDPAERLLSGYLQKCKQAGQRSQHCIGFKDTSRPVPSFEEFVLALTPKSIHGNQHFMMQSQHCGLYNKSWKFNHIIDMSSPGFQTKVRQLYLDRGVAASVVNKNYPEHKSGNTGGHDTSAKQKMTQFYGSSGRNNTLLNKVFKLFEQDYVLFDTLPQVDTDNWMFFPGRS